jgi:L-threonylcarbamoyladenylate synthase
MRQQFEQDVVNCIQVLEEGGLILYPTDTIWGIGCDATNASAIQKAFALKKREDTKTMIVLVADERDILQYVAAPDPSVFDFLESQSRPVTVIFDGALNIADNLVADDGSIGIRIVRDEFCRHVVKRFGKPIVSTSANISGAPSPLTFADISNEIRNGVDYVVKWRQNDKTISSPSRIVRWKAGGEMEIIRS